MKITFLSILAAITCLTSCENDDKKTSFERIRGEFTHKMENCNNKGNPEINCSDFINFTSDSDVGVLIGGGDITYTTTYIKVKDIITLEKASGLNFDISFKIIDSLTLKRIEDGELWKKEKDTTTIVASSISKIEHTTSFGMCIGYCIHKATIDSTNIAFAEISHRKTPKDFFCDEAIETAQWNSLLLGLDANEFFELEERFGCPDCADGGAESIEVILNNGDKHKVTFEFGKAPEAISKLTLKLRTLIDAKNNCIEENNNQPKQD